MLEPPHRGGSNEYPQSMLKSKISGKYTSCKRHDDDDLLIYYSDKEKVGPWGHNFKGGVSMIVIKQMYPINCY